MSSPPEVGPFGLPKLAGDERSEALAEPGASWRDWFYWSFLKVWIGGLGFFILDVWVAASWLSPLDVPALVLSLAGALYLEVLAFRWLWYRPDPERERATAPFRPTWLRLRRYGRWTPETQRILAGLDPFPDAESQLPDAREFL